MLASIGTPARIATTVVAVFVVLELATILGEEGLPGSRYWPGVVLLFVLMWLSAFGFTVFFRALVRDATTGGYATAHPGRVALRVLLLMVFAGAFAVLVADQLNCFLGMPHCDRPPA